MDYKDFKRKIAEIENIDNFVFRGQSNIDWPLITCYSRFLKKIRKNKPFEIESFRKMLLQFLNQFSEYHGVDYNNIPEYQKIALAQHYGIPTPFLDWSNSPYIAAYFAASDKIEKEADKKIIVYALNIKKLEDSGFIYNVEIDDLLFDNSISFKFIKTNNFYSKRVTNQQGCFTYHNFEEDLVAKLNIEQLVIPYPINNFIDVLKDLRLMGINSCNLYDDIDYISKDIKINFVLKELNSNL